MYPELRLLGRWTRSAATLGAQGAQAPWSPSPIRTTAPNLPQGKLNGKQVGAVAFCVIHSPQAGTTYDDLSRLQLVLDGEPYPWVYYHGRKDLNMAPDPSKIRYGSAILLGLPPYTDQDGWAALLDNTAPKFIDSVTVQGWAGATAIADDYTAEVWGWTYDSTKLARMAGDFVTGDVTITDLTSGTAFTVKGRTVKAGGDWRGAWTSLPGGPGQSAAGAQAVHKLVRRAKNANATTPSESYVPQYENSSSTPAVQYRSDSMYFNLNAQQAILFERLGLVGPSAPNSGGYDVLSTWIQTPGEGDHARHPQGGLPADYQLGRTKFGLVPGKTDEYAGVPELDAPILATNEVAYPTFVDNGTVIPADDVAMAIVGTWMGAPSTEGGA